MDNKIGGRKMIGIKILVILSIIATIIVTFFVSFFEGISVGEIIIIGLITFAIILFSPILIKHIEEN